MAPMTLPSPLRCRAVVLPLSILSASSPVFVVVGLSAPSMTRGVFDRRPFRLLPPGSASTACPLCNDRPLLRAAGLCCSKKRNGDDGGGDATNDDREPEEVMASTSAPGQKQQASLFIFGLGNVGSAVAKLASRVRYLGDGDEGGGELGGILLGLGAADYDDCGTEEEGAETGSRGEEAEEAVFRSIVATVRTATAREERDRLIECVQFGDRGAVRDRLSRVTHVLVTMPPRIMIRDDEDRRTYDGPAGTGSSMHLYEDPVMAAGYHNYIPTDCMWVGYVSTTGVYGDHGGGWVDESSEARAKPGSRAAGYLDVEADWTEHFGLGRRWGGRVNVFRCAGVYGPRSSALHTAWRKQRRGPATVTPDVGDDRSGRGEGRSDFRTPVGSIDSTGGDDGGAPSKRRRESYTSRVHIDDVARAIVSDMLLPPPAPPVVVRDRDPSSDDGEESWSSRSNPGAAAATAIATSRPSVDVYNLADDKPAPRSVVIAYATELLMNAKRSSGFDDDILDGWLLRTGAGRRRDGGSGRGGTTTERERRRSTDDKRVSNRRMREELLDPQCGGLSYPTYREGLASILSKVRKKGARMTCHEGKGVD